MLNDMIYLYISHYPLEFCANWWNYELDALIDWQLGVTIPLLPMLFALTEIYN